MFHADVVIGLARGRRVGRQASAPEFAALFAGICLLRRRDGDVEANPRQYQHDY